MDKGKNPISIVNDPADVATSPFKDESSSRIKSQIDRTRADMDETLNALAAELNPRRLWDDLLDILRGSVNREEARRIARKAGRKMMESVKDHPVPAALAGAGLAYLVFLEGGKEELESPVVSGEIYGRAQPASRAYGGGKSSLSSDEGVSSYEECEGVPSYEGAAGYVDEACNAGMSSTVKEKARSVKDAAAGAVESMKDSASGAVQKLKDASGSVAEKMRNATTTAAAAVRDTGPRAREAGRKMLDTVQDHPLPVTLVGAGLAYLLLFRGRKASRFERGLPASYQRGTPDVIKEKASSAAGAVRNTASSAMQSASETASNAVQSAKETAAGALGSIQETAGSMRDSAAGTVQSMKDTTGYMAGTVRDTASGAFRRFGEFIGVAKNTVASAADAVTHRTSDLAHKVSDLSHDIGAGAKEASRMAKSTAVGVGRQAQHGYDVGRRKAVEVSDEHPLALGAALIGLGVLVGLSVPRTRREDEFIGGQAEDLKRRAKDTARDLIDRGMHIAQVTAEETIDEAKRQGLAPSTIAEKARRVASEIRDKAGEAAQREQITPDALGEKVKAVAEHAKDAAQQELGQRQQNLQETIV